MTEQDPPHAAQLPVIPTPPVTLDATRVTDVLLATTGWEMIREGSFHIGPLNLNPDPGAKPKEEWGIDYITQGGQHIVARISALLAVEMK